MKNINKTDKEIKFDEKIIKIAEQAYSDSKKILNVDDGYTEKDFELEIEEIIDEKLKNEKYFSLHLNDYKDKRKDIDLRVSKYSYCEYKVELTRFSRTTKLYYTKKELINLFKKILMMSHIM